jgi:hypothetical protein
MNRLQDLRQQWRFGCGELAEPDWSDSACLDLVLA